MEEEEGRGSCHYVFLRAFPRADGQGQPGVDLFTAGRLGGCAEAEVCNLRT